MTKTQTAAYTPPKKKWINKAEIIQSKVWTVYHQSVIIFQN